MSDPGRRDVALTGIVSGVSRFATAAGAFLVFPFVLQRYGAAETGIWATVVSLTSIVGFADMGIGAALMNRIARLHVAKDRPGIAQLLGASMVVSVAICLFLLLVFFILLPVLNWSKILGLGDVGGREIVITASLVIPTLIALPFSLVARVQLAAERGRFDAVWQLVASVLSVVVLFCITRSGLGVWAAILASTGVPSLIKILQSFVYVYGDPVYQSSAPFAIKAWLGEFLYPATMFFVLQVCSVVAFSLDLYIANKSLGDHDTVQYAAMLRIFSVPQVLVGLLTGALWPQFARLYAKGDFMGLKRMLSNTLLGATGLAFVFGGVLMAVRLPLFSLWLGREYAPSLLLVMMLTISTAVILAGTLLASALNAMEILGYQLSSAIILAVGGFLLKSYLCQIYGSVGLPIGTVAVYIPACLIPALFILKKRFTPMLVHKL
jgi:O-antigen/teichoic acid export membrane protein